MSECLTFHSNTCDVFIDKLPSEYEANPELLFYRITHLNHRQQYLIWAAAVTTAGRGNFSDKVTVEPAAKGKSKQRMVPSSTAVLFKKKGILQLWFKVGSW